MKDYKLLILIGLLLLGGYMNFMVGAEHGSLILLIIGVIIGLYILVEGGAKLVDGSTSIAKKYSIPPIVIGLTILSFGTSAPEFFVNVIAAMNGETDIMISNVIGSNIANILLILGVTGLLIPLAVGNNTVYKEIPFSLLAVAVLAVLANDMYFAGGSENILTRADGIILLMFFVIFMYYVFSLAKSGDVDGLDELEEMGMGKSLMYLLVGLFGLYIGGDLIVANASAIATSMDISKIVVGATIVAIGTSLPELVASVMAALKKQADMAVGNVIGSNIFNIFWIAGAGALVTNVPFQSTLNFHMLLLLVITLVVLLIIYFKPSKSLHKYEGVAFLILYFGYLTYLVVSSIQAV